VIQLILFFFYLLFSSNTSPLVVITWQISQAISQSNIILTLLYHHHFLLQSFTFISNHFFSYLIFIFHNVCFSYDEKNIFKDLSFDIPAGSSIAFVGERGSGKSTIVKQIMGLIKPDSGDIYVDGNDLSELNLNNFYNYISYTSQESPIFDGTLRENIILDKDIADDIIIEVLERVGLTSFYDALPKGLHTEVGERGVMLSGGERQRLLYWTKLLQQWIMLLKN